MAHGNVKRPIKTFQILGLRKEKIIFDHIDRNGSWFGVLYLNVMDALGMLEELLKM